MKRKSTLVWVVACSLLGNAARPAQAIECGPNHPWHRACCGQSGTGVGACLFGCSAGGAGSRSATNFGYGRISRPRPAFVPCPVVQAPAPTYAPVPVLGGVGGAVTAPPAMPVAPYAPPQVVTAPATIPSVPAPASVAPCPPPVTAVPPCVACEPCYPCPAPVCVPCTPYPVCPSPCAAPVETCVPIDPCCDPCCGPEMVVPTDPCGGCNPCGPALAPPCGCVP
jgi:hypothetical protein